MDLNPLILQLVAKVEEIPLENNTVLKFYTDLFNLSSFMSNFSCSSSVAS